VALSLVMMDKEERWSALIGDIYDVALDPALWPDTLAKIAGFVGGQSAGLFSKDSVNKAANAYYTFGCDPRYLKLSLGNSWKFDPFASLPFFDVAQVVSTDNFMPYDEYRETPFHREWARPQGLVDSASAVLDKSVTGIAFLSVLRMKPMAVSTATRAGAWALSYPMCAVPCSSARRSISDRPRPPRSPTRSTG
jgi:hypothetical protein